ncbi:AN1-type zinc finger protein 4 isoform X1 [Tachysurus vachellii]|uniref:AN1-type zinc finger protein 4 isoform X1 n=1 Tax=Tachysurus vachellii TaxID=175792 RepID=UPI00296B392D|nr:AN1-type zinc finger protein 4 isoform X1 [Tachysurus vachellii]XP_060728329.1 AN1-type zinc finger protein 4 isoform X1 [Tachysurus vachellii]XP_060728330.1 AN1-type zinc finger protein 4 isoform X1 [Tachysurus vachellii]
MAEKREPPFFNNDNLGVVNYKLPFYETMELFIETLTGTCFQLRVSPFETIVSVKAKIQRLEGIPVAQQHLIWNNLELDDEYCLNDYSIAEGCTIKLVLAMRGGPINTKRVTIENSVKHSSDCLDSKKDEVWEKSLSNKQVTFLVYKEGDQLNVFRVVDRGDGTLTPVSKSLSSGSVHNVYAEEEEEGVSISSAQLMLENSITMNKMKLLKAKMENMNLNKKPKKSTKLRVRPPVGPRPFCGSLGSARHHRMLRIPPQMIGHTPVTQLPPIGDQQQSSSEAGPPFTCHPSFASGRPISSLTTSSKYIIQEEEPWNKPTPRNIRLPPKVSRLDVGAPNAITDCLYPPIPVLSGLEAEDETEIQSDGLMLPEDGVMMEPSKPFPFNNLLQEPLSLDLSAQPEASLDSLGALNEPLTATPLLSQVVGSDNINTWSIGTKTLQSQSDRAALNSLHTPPLVPRPFTDFTTEVSRPFLGSNRAPTVPPRPTPQTPPLHHIRVDSPGKRSDGVYKSEAQDVTNTANISKELSGCVSNIDEKHARPCDLARFSGTNAPLQANIHLLREDLLRRIVPLQRATYTPSGILDSSGLSSSIKRLGSPTYLLPPLKAPPSSKKKTSKHCFLCGKKTGLATSYECRCGNNFCSTHRYAETHNCTYDYKSAGRRFLQKSNPIISAPKLPKI